MTLTTTETFSTIAPILPKSTLLSKMSLNAEASATFLQFLIPGQAQALHQTSRAHRDQITPDKFMKIRLECKDALSYQDIQLYKNLTNASLRSSKIFHLNLGGASISDTQVVELLDNFPALTSLVLNHKGVMEQGFNKTFEKIVHLGFQNISITDPQLIQCLQRFPNVESLNFFSISQLTNTGFQNAMNFVPHLKNLYMNTSIFSAGTFELQDEDLIEVAKKHPDLQTLEIEGCDLNGTTLRAVADQLSDLRTLNIKDCSQITGEDLIYLAKKCPRLETLIIGRNSSLNSSNFRQIMEHCSKLQYLDVTSCKELKGDDLIFATNACPALHTLNHSVKEFVFNNRNNFKRLS